MEKRKKKITLVMSPLQIEILYECISLIPPAFPKAMVTSAAIKMPIQLCTFYFPYCTKKHRYAKRSSRALRGIKGPRWEGRLSRG